MSEAHMKDNNTSDHVIVTLCFLFVLLVLLLVYLYVKLNRETNGQYSLSKMVYKKGGVRDWVRGRVRTIENRLGRRLWPLGENEEEVDDDEGEERDVEGGSEKGESEEEEEKEGDEGYDYSSLESGNMRDRAEGRHDREGRRESTGKDREDREATKDEVREDEEVKAGVEEREGNGGGDLQIGLKHFSGSVMWSEEQKNQEDDNNVTAF